MVLAEGRGIQSDNDTYGTFWEIPLIFSQHQPPSIAY